MKKFYLQILLLFSLSLLLSCKKEFLKKRQSGTYTGNLHYQASYTTWDYTYDSVTMEVNRYEKIYTSHEIDTIYADTASIEFFNDSIFITHRGGLYNFPINKSSKYQLSYSGYTIYDYVLSEDTLFATHSWVIDRGGDRPGTAITNSVLIKEN